MSATVDRAKHGDATHVWIPPMPIRIVDAGIGGGRGDRAAYCYTILAGNQCIGELRVTLAGERMVVSVGQDVLTKKHFEAIARILNSTIRSTEMWGHEMGTDDLIGLFADYLEKQNDHFDRDRFYTACYQETKARPITR